MTRLLLLFILFISFWNLQAEIYQTRDANGNIVFTDQASSGAKIVQLAPPNMYQMNIPTLPPELSVETLAFAQSSHTTTQAVISLTITSPDNNDTWLLSETSYQVNFVIRPDLAVNQQAILLVNGLPLPGLQIDGPQANNSLSFTVNMVDLQNTSNFSVGAMNLQVAIINKADNKQIAVSNEVAVTIYRTTNRMLAPLKPAPSQPIHLN